jgi:predicted secreted protein
MGIMSGAVLFAVIWWMTFFVLLPVRVKTQGDLGQVEPGTHAGAPQVHHLKRKAWITTAIAAVLWLIIAPIIIMGWLPVSEMDIFQLELDPL